MLGPDRVRDSLRSTAAAAFWNLHRQLATSHRKLTKRLIHRGENHRWSHHRIEGKGARSQGQTTGMEVAWKPGAWRRLRLDQHRKLYLLLPQTDPHRTFNLRAFECGTEAAIGPSPSEGARWLQSVPASRGSPCSESLLAQL